ncbi:MAG TPA: DUF4129 domain-containing protein [Bryobacteraceae bacterium]|nr:DUF4129 domain-containing protein [Bryobacteraceae bacterium]
MKRPAKSAVELYEEGVFLLRRAPPSALAAYYAGSIPFVLGFLFFWSDMSQSAFAYDHCAPAALAVALLYLWMMFWQSLFIQKLHAELSGAPSPTWRSRETRRIGFLQLAVQPTKFVVLPIALLVLLPFASVYAFYQNVMSGRNADFNAAKKQARAWQSQNWTLLAILAMLQFVVFINMAAAILLAPYLAKMLLGIESAFTRSVVANFNTTFLAVTAGLTYLVTNPLAKAVYLLRYFYGESIETGEDLRVAQAFLPTLLLLFIPAFLSAQPAPPATAATISVDQLNHSIDDVIHRPEFTWRLPRAPHREENANWFVRTTQSFLDATARGIRQIGRWINQFINWLGEKLKSLIPGLGGNKPGADSRKLRALLYTLLVAVAALLSWLLWRTLQLGRKACASVAIPVASPIPDLNAADLEAGSQPLDQWMQLARDCIARQEFRLALRALYLASLAYLADRSLISIERGKSNEDYARELRRKARGSTEMVAAFAQNMGTFERSWYGQHAVDRLTLEQFENNLTKMRTGAPQQ